MERIYENNENNEKLTKKNKHIPIKLIETFETAPYGSSLFSIWVSLLYISYINNYYLLTSLWTALTFIWIAEIKRSLILKKRILSFLEKRWFKKLYFKKLKEHFCDRKAALSALKRYKNWKYIEEVKKIFNEKKNK